jgi:hypothetical protein
MWNMEQHFTYVLRKSAPFTSSVIATLKITEGLVLTDALGIKFHPNRSQKYGTLRGKIRLVLSVRRDCYSTECHMKHNNKLL